MQVSDKTGKVAHYIISHADPDHFALTKLCKMMWHADVSHYRLYGESVTGQLSYARKDHGPVPNGLYEHLRDLKSRNVIFEQRELLPSGNCRKRFFPIEPAETSWFSSTEIESLQTAIRAIGPLRTSDASERTHGPLWEILSDGEQMSIPAASVIAGEISTEDVEWARAQFAAEG